MVDHVFDDVPALLAGSLSRDRTREVADHLRACEECRRDLVEAAHANAALRSAARMRLVPAPTADPPAHAHGEPPAPPVTLPPLPARTRRSHARRTRRMVAAAAAVAVLAGGTATVAVATRTPAAARSVALHPVAGDTGYGSVAMTGRGGLTTMTVRTDLPAPAPGHYYEVWLFDPGTDKMLAVGMLSADGRISVQMPDGTVSAYQAVDISLQADDGNPAHSDVSVLRARYA